MIFFMTVVVLLPRFLNHFTSIRDLSFPNLEMSSYFCPGVQKRTSDMNDLSIVKQTEADLFAKRQFSQKNSENVRKREDGNLLW